MSASIVNPEGSPHSEVGSDMVERGDAGVPTARRSGSPPASLDRFAGALIGLAVGDALGTTLEFTRPGSFRPITDMVGGGPFGLQPGQWTDDTSMAMCLAESLIASNGFDPVDQLRRYVAWQDEGYWSSTGDCFDIGNVVRGALAEFRRTGAAFCGPTDDNTAGNGSLMRLAPIPMFFEDDGQLAIAMAGESSRVTHGTPMAVDACRYFAALIVGALRGEERMALLAPRYTPVPGLWDRAPLHPAIDEVAAGSFARKGPPAIRGTGFVVQSLEAALWAFATTDDFEGGALAAVNLGEDADTTGAIYGQLAGAFYGVRAIPTRWRETITRGAEIQTIAERLAGGHMALPVDARTAERRSARECLASVGGDLARGTDRVEEGVRAMGFGGSMRGRAGAQYALHLMRSWIANGGEPPESRPDCDRTA